MEVAAPPPGFRKSSLGLDRKATPELASRVRLDRTNPYRKTKNLIRKIFEANFINNF